MSDDYKVLSKCLLNQIKILSNFHSRNVCKLFWILETHFYFPDGSLGKEFACNAGDTEDAGSVPGLERSSGEGNGNPLQYFCLENPKERGASLVGYRPKGDKELDVTTHP